MSRVLKQFPVIAKRRPPASRYDWALWFDGRVHALSAREFGNAYVFRNAAHAMATRRGIRIRTAVVDGEMVIQATVVTLKLAACGLQVLA